MGKEIEPGGLLDGSRPYAEQRTAEVVEGDPYSVDRLPQNLFLSRLYERAELLNGFGMEPRGHLNAARQLHPQRYCAKDVYAASCVATSFGEIVMYTRNGLPMATPSHRQEYRVGNLLEIANRLPSSDERKTMTEFLGLLDPNQITDCLTIRKYSGTPVCLKGFPYANSKARAKHPSDLFCPNSRAGCSERNLLFWLPYALSLQKELQKKGDLIISEVRFDSDNLAPLIRYFSGNDQEWRSARLTKAIETQEINGFDQTLIVSMTPCLVCADQIISSGVKRIIIDRYSKYYASENYCYVDEDDLGSLRRMTEAGVAISHVRGTRRPVMRDY